jgi:hypothetical protein
MMMKRSNPRSNNNKHHLICVVDYTHMVEILYFVCVEIVEVANGHVAFCYNNHFA